MDEAGNGNRVGTWIGMRLGLGMGMGCEACYGYGTGAWDGYGTKAHPMLSCLGGYAAMIELVWRYVI